MRRNLKALFIFLIVSIGLISSCKKDDVPENPYDGIDRTTNTTTPVEPDPNTIVGLHKNIFFPKCANPGCHDGTFEPDYRTVESTFSTLVYQPVNKVCLEDSIKFYSQRVIPHNTADSWLIERLTTSSNEYMPSNSVRLSSDDINHVKAWINNGCPDKDGGLPVRPNLEPNIIGYVALDANNVRLDTNRVGGFPLNAFIVPMGTTMTFAFAANDTADGDQATPDSLFTVKEVHFSTNKNNFAGASVVGAQLYVSQFKIWVMYIPVLAWPVGTTVYFRIYVNDGHHAQNTEFPRNETLDYYKTIYSFYVQ